MECNTSALCDLYEDEVEVVEPVFRSFGGSSSFSGQVVTVSCYESTGLVRSALSDDGTGKVLVIDAGGSMRRAVIDADIACTAYDSGWEGIIVFGAVRKSALSEEHPSASRLWDPSPWGQTRETAATRWRMSVSAV